MFAELVAERFDVALEERLCLASKWRLFSGVVKVRVQSGGAIGAYAMGEIRVRMLAHVNLHLRPVALVVSNLLA